MHLDVDAPFTRKLKYRLSDVNTGIGAWVERGCREDFDVRVISRFYLKRHFRIGQEIVVGVMNRDLKRNRRAGLQDGCGLETNGEIAFAFLSYQEANCAKQQSEQFHEAYCSQRSEPSPLPSFASDPTPSASRGCGSGTKPASSYR